MKPPIKSRKILAVEGKDECEFFQALFKHMNISDVRIEEVGGKVPIPIKSSTRSEPFRPPVPKVIIQSFRS